jgi:hypothetical protein
LCKIFNLDATRFANARDNFTRRGVGKLRLVAETHVVGGCSCAFVDECRFIWKFFYG